MPARAEWVGWGVLTVLSCATAWAAWTLPPRSDPPDAPPALARAPTDAELAAVAGLLRSLQEELDQARATRGLPLAINELESVDADGGPLLPSGLPDNPLRLGVAGVLARCPPDEARGDEVDWIYCPESGQMAAVGLSPEG